MNYSAFVFGAGCTGKIRTNLEKSSQRNINSSSFMRSFSTGKKRTSANIFIRNHDFAETRTEDTADFSPSSTLEPVEDGIKLPPLQSPEHLEEETGWLEMQIREWLDIEWEQGEPQQIHADIGVRAGQVYKRQRMEGEDDLSSVLLAIGLELEGMDFSSAFVGPWNVANKTAEFLLEHRAGPRVKLKPYVRDPNAPSWARDKSKQKNTPANDVKTGTRVPSAPSLADYFEKLKFLRDILDMDVPKELIDGAVAAAVGFRYDEKHGSWDGSGVEDEHFKQFGNKPPDVLGDESVADHTETLQHLKNQLAADEDAGELKEESEEEEEEDEEEDEEGTENIEMSLDVIIETLHGTELTKIHMNDKNNHAFHKRAVLVKWLHMRGGY